MALRNQPYFPLYVQDYLTDEKLNNCSWRTQGVYIKILCILHKQKEYGCILFKQIDKQNSSTIQIFASILIKNIPCQLSDMIESLTELIENEVLIIDGQKLYQKRMVKDGHISEQRSKSAKKGGGNPILFKQNSKQTDKQNTEYEYTNENENEISNRKGIIKNLCKVENSDLVLVAFEKWRDYLQKQHSIILLENEYTYDVLIDAIKRVKDGNVIKSIDYSINSGTYKKIYLFKEDIKKPLSHLNQAAKIDSDY